MGAARDAAKQSMALTEARDRDGWLALFADDAVVEDPVGPSMFDPEGTGHRGIAAITAFYDNVISTSEKVEFTIRDSYECGSEVANVGQIRITLPGGQVGVVPIVNIYKVDDAGRLLSLRSFWESDKLAFDPA
jgi:ketosteroid isomerase-like protein